MKTTLACIRLQYVKVKINGFGCRHLLLTIDKVRTRHNNNRWHWQLNRNKRNFTGNELKYCVIDFVLLWLSVWWKDYVDRNNKFRNISYTTKGNSAKTKQNKIVLVAQMCAG